MGIFWDLIQQDELEKQKKQANSLEDRVAHLEEDLSKTHPNIRLWYGILQNIRQSGFVICPISEEGPPGISLIIKGTVTNPTRKFCLQG